VCLLAKIWLGLHFERFFSQTNPVALSLETGSAAAAWPVTDHRKPFESARAPALAPVATRARALEWFSMVSDGSDGSSATGVREILRLGHFFLLKVAQYILTLVVIRLGEILQLGQFFYKLLYPIYNLFSCINLPLITKVAIFPNKRQKITLRCMAQIFTTYLFTQISISFLLLKLL
jgi:hypothetical protein